MPLRHTLVDLTAAIRTNLDEIAPSFWPAADIPQFVNRAKDKCWLEVRKADLGFFEQTRTSLDGSQTILGEPYDCASFRIVAGQRDFTLPPDFATLVANQCLTVGFEGVRLAYRRHNDPDFRRALEDTTRRTPIYYTLMGERTWRVAPLSDTTYDWSLTYAYVVPDLSGTSTLDMPYPLYMAVEQYATAEALMKDHSQDAAAWEAKGNATIALFLGTTTRETTDMPVVSGWLEDL